MRAKKVLAFVCTATLSFTILAGCGQSSQSTDDLLAQLAEKGRQTGYMQSFVEMQYIMHNSISEDDYQNYIEAKQQYESDISLDNLNALIEAIENVLLNMP